MLPSGSLTMSINSKCAVPIWKVKAPSKMENESWCQNALKKPTDELYTSLCTEVFDLFKESQ